jgi:hypothetical protein
MKGFREDTESDADYVLVYRTDMEEHAVMIPNHMICKHCGERVESGIIGRGNHSVSCTNKPVPSPLTWDRFVELYMNDGPTEIRM